MRKTAIQLFFKISMRAVTFFALFLLVSNTAYGQAVEKSIAQRDKPWGIGTSITYPLAEIYMMQASYSPWGSGEILGGAAYQNWKNDQGRASAYTVLLGYRQYVWRGLHTEMELWPAYNPFLSSIDGKTYAGFELWMSLRIGYRFDFQLAGNDIFILTQPGLGFGVARENPWPEKGKGDGAVFEPQVILGIKL
jgi:hypothetical protein